MLPTPDLSHLSSKDFECVYEPAEDTFLMLDALEQEKDFLLAMKPCLGLEVGSGSGCAITFLEGLLKPQRIACLATDLNPSANYATLRTAERNLTSVDSILTSLSNGLDGVRNAFDVLIFNPPYVPTECLCPSVENPCRQSITGCKPEMLLEAAWAGGENGRHWIDQFMPRVDGLLSKNGVFYMIVLDANMPEQLMEWAKKEWNFNSKVIAKRRCGIEFLRVVKFCKSI